ncbi:egg cell-secreted protein 1.1-like [Magnolia sinica]|uniref:egg cell-secreted protein 1.1-like n=1 Tax=Magnolia sinica TaxID=86752 RepID=UPI002657E644|nr:egg cell-secreted protein 1.1-like [Magnolia sinica]
MKNAGVVSMVLIMAIVAMSVMPWATVAVQAEEHKLIIPWLPFPDPQIEKCWSSLLDIPGCALEIFSAFLNHQINVGPACCKAITDIGENCWPKMLGFLPFNPLPYNPLVPPMIKSYCSSKLGHAPTPR